MSVIIYGPQGCGKSRLQKQLQAKFGLDNVIDDWSTRQVLPPNTLALTNENCSQIPNAIHYGDALPLLASAVCEICTGRGEYRRPYQTKYEPCPCIPGVAS